MHEIYHRWLRGAKSQQRLLLLLPFDEGKISGWWLDVLKEELNMNVRKKIKNLLFLLMLSIVFSITFVNSKTVFATSTGSPLVGQISLFPYSFAPYGWAECNGQLLPCSENPFLYALIGNRFGGNGSTTFALPDLRTASPLPNAKYYISLDGMFPVFEEGLAEATTGAVSMFPYGKAPSGWLPCDGASLAASQNPALYSIISTNYGGDSTNFKLPDLRDTEPIPNINYYICVQGYYPNGAAAGDELLGSIDLFAFEFQFVQGNTFECSGQEYLANLNQALCSLIGVMYGGDSTNFKLPDLRGAVPSPKMHYCLLKSGIYPSRP
jgi:microcystin-dependent protein